jgi:hypothetical protein
MGRLECGNWDTIPHLPPLQRHWKGPGKRGAVMILLSDKPIGFRVDGNRILTHNGPGFKAFRAKMCEHLEELAVRYYAGDVTVVDEFLQLYCIGENARNEREANENEANGDKSYFVFAPKSMRAETSESEASHD